MARLADDSALYGEPWLVASELRFDARDALVLRGAPLDEARLRADFPQRFEERIACAGTPVRARCRRAASSASTASCWTRARPGASIRSRRRRRSPRRSPNSASSACPGARRRGSGASACAACAPGSRNSACRTSATRRCWPNASSGCDRRSPGKTRLDALDERELAEALAARLDWPQRQALDRLAPTGIDVPSGLRRAIAYAHGAPPVLAVKLQELFGLADTPRIADGRVPLTLHLLSPGGKPLQVTQDLRGFWDRTYPEVRKEMKGRYPRHPWPEDPWAATPTHRAKPRGT
jgi:ATP-dependent helicase HrpB